MKTIGEKVKEFREARGWNSTRMAKEVGTSRQNIETLEVKGNRRPHYIVDLARVMGTTVDALLQSNFTVPTEQSQLTAPSAFLSATGGPGGAAVSQDTASPPSSPESIGQAVEFIASKLAPLDQGTRETIATLVHEAICKPEKTAANLAAIQALVRFATGKIETEAYLHTAKAS